MSVRHFYSVCKTLLFLPKNHSSNSVENCIYGTVSTWNVSFRVWTMIYTWKKYSIYELLMSYNPFKNRDKSKFWEKFTPNIIKKWENDHTRLISIWRSKFLKETKLFCKNKMTFFKKFFCWSPHVQNRAILWFFSFSLWAWYCPCVSVYIVAYTWIRLLWDLSIISNQSRK